MQSITQIKISGSIVSVQESPDADDDWGRGYNEETKACSWYRADEENGYGE